MHRHNIEKTGCKFTYYCIKCDDAWSIEHCAYGDRMLGKYIIGKAGPIITDMSNFKINKLLHGCFISDKEYKFMNLLR